MPTVLRVGPYRFGFYSADRGEPPHVHVKRDRKESKFWIEPEVEFEWNAGYAPRELNLIRKLIDEHRAFLVERWHDHFGE